MTEVFISHINLALPVAMVTENGHQNRLKWSKCHFGAPFGGLTDSFFKN